jgi:uncharacterized protein YjbI with pentapeptide repeats
MSKTILILAANPRDTSRLRLDREVREIDSGLQRASRRDEFILRQVWAARPTDVRRVMLDVKPDIVHFCGHGAGKEGIAFEDESGNTKLVNTKALAGFFALFSDKVDCVLLNACYSEVQAKAIARHIKYVIGMKRGIGDTAAVEFAVAFYDALGAGESIEFAFSLACNAIQWADIPQSLIPSLKTKSDKNTNKGAADKSSNDQPRQINKTALFTLLREIFEDEEAIRSFSLKHLIGKRNYFTPRGGLSITIQSLINYYERHESLDNLIEIIQREYPVKYGICQESLHHPSMKPEASLVINKGVVELRLRGDMDLQKPNIDDFLDDLKKSLVNYFGLKLQDVFIMEIRKGSIIIRGLFSESAIDKLSRTDSETLAREFGIEMVEILDSILVRVDLQGANLRGVDLSANDLRSADMRGANAQGAVLRRTVLRLADLRRADLRMANLQGADLRGANLSEANLENADLVGADLEEAILEHTYLRGADLRLANIRHAQLESTVYDQTTKLPFDEIK